MLATGEGPKKLSNAGTFLLAFSLTATFGKNNGETLRTTNTMLHSHIRGTKKFEHAASLMLHKYWNGLFFTFITYIKQRILVIYNSQFILQRKRLSHRNITGMRFREREAYSRRKFTVSNIMCKNDKFTLLSVRSTNTGY